MPARITDEAGAYQLLELVRWGGVPASCPHCDGPGRCYLLTPADGSSRPTRTGSRTQRRVWKCGLCRQQFSVLAGTVFEGSRVGVLTWLRFVADIADGSLPSTITARAQRCGVAPETARRMMRRMERTAVAEPELLRWLSPREA